MKYIFVVDDNQYKREGIVAALKELYPSAIYGEEDCVSHAINSWLRIDRYRKAIISEPYECLLVIDMQMPMRVGESSNFVAGHRLLAVLEHEGVKCPAMLVSSESVSDEQAATEYSNYIGSVIYSHWRRDTEAYKSLIEAWQEKCHNNKE